MSKKNIGALLILLVVSLQAKIIHSDGMSLSILNARSPAVPPVVLNRAGYFTIINHSDKAIVIIGAQSVYFENAEFHETRVKNGVTTMSEINSILVQPKESIELKPGGLHLMLMGVNKEPLSGSATLPIKLLLDGGDAIDVKLVVEHKMAKEKMMDHSGHKSHGHH